MIMNKKYNTPRIKIEFFLADRIVTSSGTQENYITALENLRQSEEYKAKQEAFSNLLAFQE